MVKILLNQLNDDQPELFKILKNSKNLRALIAGQKGGKQADKITQCREYLKDHKLYQELRELYKQKLNEKLVYMLVHDIVKDVQNTIDKRKKGQKAAFPKAKKLSKINNFSLNFDNCKVKFNKKDNKIKLCFGREWLIFDLPYQSLSTNFLTNFKTIYKSFKLVYRLGHIEFVFHKKSDNVVPSHQFKKKAGRRKEKTAALDLGFKRLFTLFVNDDTTPSIAYENSEIINENCHYAYRTAKLQQIMNLHFNHHKDKDHHEYRHLKKRHNNAFYYRNNYFSDLFHKMSVEILNYCAKHGVTRLVVSKNLSFAKTDGSIKLVKRQKQPFYQIPFGKLIKMLEAKAKHFRIKIENVDEAYTSKTFFNKNIQNVIQEVKSLKDNQQKVPSTVFGGIRDGDTFYVNGRGKNNTLKIHADINGAINHIQVSKKPIKTDYLLEEKNRFKITQPLVVKSLKELRQLAITDLLWTDGAKAA
tara:strand:- start:13824 stop:15239 length:1416 start_codon:yes stop_codon:yes gene_type:complete